MPKPVKWFSNGRGFNFLPDFMERIPGGSRPLTKDPIPYSSTNNTVVFWRYYDPISIEQQINSLRNMGINNLRIWFNYYAWKYHDDISSSFFLDNINNQSLTCPYFLDKNLFHPQFIISLSPSNVFFHLYKLSLHWSFNSIA